MLKERSASKVSQKLLFGDAFLLLGHFNTVCVCVSSWGLLLLLLTKKAKFLFLIYTHTHTHEAQRLHLKSKTAQIEKPLIYWFNSKHCRQKAKETGRCCEILGFQCWVNVQTSGSEIISVSAEGNWRHMDLQIIIDEGEDAGMNVRKKKRQKRFSGRFR